MFDALCFDETVVVFEEADALAEFVHDGVSGVEDFFVGHDEVFAGEDHDFLEGFDDFSGGGVVTAYFFDFVAEEADADKAVALGRVDVDGFAPDSELSFFGSGVVAFVLGIDEVTHDVVTADVHSLFDGQAHFHEVFGFAESVDAGDGGDDDDISAFEQRGGGGEAQTVDIFVDGGVFGDVGIGLWDVGFGEVVIVV